MKIVAVSGGFDPIHVGHINYLKEAKKLGDELVVILNTDEFLKKKKGYVFMPYLERKKILESIRFVNRVVRCIDRDQTVAKTLEWLKPDVFAKGGDRIMSNIPQTEKAVCCRLNIEIALNVGGKKTQSSSWLIERLRESVKE